MARRLLVPLAIAVAAAATAVGVVALLAGRAPGDGSWPLLPVAIAGVAAALVARPARRLGDRFARQVRAGAPSEVLRRLESERLDDPESIERLCESFLRTYRLASVEVWAHQGEGRLERMAAVPARGEATRQLDESAIRSLLRGGVSGSAWVDTWAADLPSEPGELRLVPAVHAEDLHAMLVLRRPPGERFGPADDRTLGELGRLLGLLLHNRQLGASLVATLDDLRATNEQLRASRIRLVSTADAERRRIERDLHDGAQQHLAAVAVNLGLARQTIAGDPTTALELLDELSAEVRDAINQLRSLAHGIYPPLLASSGLVAALKAAAERSPSPVTVVADGVGRYPPEAEGAVYFCCLEAIHNAAKHAAGASVRLELRGRTDELWFVVEDEGPGIVSKEPHGSGQGLVNMTDRIGAVGGQLTIGQGGAGGVRIEGSVPGGGVG